MCWNIAAAAVSSLLGILTSSLPTGRMGSWENALLLLVGLKFFRTSESGREKRTGFDK